MNMKPSKKAPVKKTNPSFDYLSYPDAPKITICPPGPQSKKILDYQSRHEGSSVSYPKGLPMAIRRARGATIEDVDGNTYIDFFAGAGVMAVGHAHPEVLEAAKKQMDEVTHTLDIPHPARIELDQCLFKLLPKKLTRIFYGGPTGSDAVEQAIKLAKYNTKRFPVIAFQGSYHGMTAGALSLTSALYHRDGIYPLMSDVSFLPYPYCYRCPFNDRVKTCGIRCAEYLSNVLNDPHSGFSKPAAVIIEAIQGEGGSIVPPSAFMRRLREICDQHGIILICDEIQSGLWRTGTPFSFEHSGIIPDIITISKALGGLGFPLAAIAYREDLNTLPPGKSIGTFRGNMIAYAAGAKAIDFMIDNNIGDYVSKLGNTMLTWLTVLEKESSFIGEVRGKGLMLGVEFVTDKRSKEPAPSLVNKVRTYCHQHGLIIEVGGHFNNVARFLPPLIISEALAEKGVEIFRKAVKSLEK
jgi:diaminobutyrate-2-oxoglutarate transaminase